MIPTPLDVIRAETAERAQAAEATKVAFPLIIDSTSRSDFVACPTKFREAHILHLRGMDTNVHLHFGACYAKGLEVLRRAFWSPTSRTYRDARAAFAAGAEAIIHSWGDYKPEIRTSKTLEGCLDAYLSFLETYPLESDPVVPFMLNNEPCVEFSFALPIPGTRHPETGGPVLYAGRFDMLATMREHGNSVFVDDEKTTSQLGASWLNQWRLRGQLTGYVWACHQYGYPVAGVIVRGSSILTKSIGQAMVIEQRYAWMVQRWLNQLSRDVTRMVEMWERDEWDQAFDSACSSYGGCAYLPLCSSPNPDNWRKNYQVRPWDPLARGG